MHTESTHMHIIDVRVLKRSGPRCGTAVSVSRQLSVHLSSCTHLFCVVPAPVLQWYVACAKLALVITMCVQTSWESPLRMMLLAQAISVHGQIVFLTNTLSLHIWTCALHEGIWPSVLLVQQGWAPAKQHTKNSYSCWSMRATCGYQSDCENRSNLEDHKTCGPAKENERVSEVVDEADRGRGCGEP